MFLRLLLGGGRLLGRLNYKEEDEEYEQEGWLVDANIMRRKASG